MHPSPEDMSKRIGCDWSENISSDFLLSQQNLIIFLKDGTAFLEPMLKF